MTGAKAAPIFCAENLSLDLGGREVLRRIGFKLGAGEVLGIIGPNGAGKTSLLEILSGRYQPKTGKVVYKGRDITRLPLFERARMGLGRTYQTPIVCEDLTVGETFKAARQAYKPYLTRFDAEYGANLVQFRTPQDRPNSQLKTFERRKLLLANLLMRRPEVLLMDEPAAGLINAEIDEIDQILRMLSKEMNMAVLIVEHRMELLDSIADRVIVMDAGEIIAEGKLADIIDSPAVRAAYFEAH
ncbi:ABC transporter ATP-binding protein [Pontibaca methylaminivorans]|uniref:Amino acid/amide ABC transporter ATP-binding protein 1, HAAT family n=1 Tax=Pontibaca methylaminivorans TaxID=515897 RepID=A0A1R3WS62_9RHOB|nr:ATP-binding cassette domain-containing protein [Pontibaca methylaminivorans]SIT80107.1 amino acid/amide ABC transporter ATP-binding protein 1, HAAT family [Pontibaca methylaminivorans]